MNKRLVLFLVLILLIISTACSLETEENNRKIEEEFD